MPNWCSNDIDIQFGNKEEYKDFEAKVLRHERATEGFSIAEDGEEINFDETKEFPLFDLYVPTPPELLESEGWYEWRLKNWGTKWNPSINYIYAFKDKMFIQIGSETAWSPPIEFFETFSKIYPSATIEMTYIEESMNFCGKTSFRNGDVRDRYINDMPIEMWVDAGAVLGEDGTIDWDKSDVTMWTILEDDEKFNKYHNLLTRG